MIQGDDSLVSTNSVIQFEVMLNEHNNEFGLFQLADLE